MSVTRAQVETILVRRAGDLLALAGLDGTSHAGANADLADPIACAVRAVGHGTADPTNPTDADLAAVTADELDELLDAAEVRALETCHTALLDLVDVAAGPRREALSQTAHGLAAKIERLQLGLRRAYGAGLGTVEAGVITLEIAERGEG